MRAVGRWRSDVDSEMRMAGEALFQEICSMLVGDIYSTPDEIAAVFNEMLADAALLHGWWQDSEGEWYRPILYAVPS